MRVLSIDGGGIRGIIPALVLADLEARAGRPVAELFDLIAGTSTGGLLALALTRPGPGGRPAWRAEETVALYERSGPDIFSRSLGRRIASADGVLDEKYSSDPLRRALERYLGTTRLREALRDVLVTAYDIERREPFFFKSARARQDPARDYPMVEAALATAAAPTYFEPEPARSAAGSGAALVDGGVFAVNPAMSAYAEARRDGAGDDVVLVSLGCGQHTRSIPYRKARGWGTLQWVRPLIDVVFDGSSDVVDYQLRQVLGDRFHRFQIELDRASDALDDASSRNLALLREQGERLVSERAADLERLARELR